jgi:hypothetical protein
VRDQHSSGASLRGLARSRRSSSRTQNVFACGGDRSMDRTCPSVDRECAQRRDQANIAPHRSLSVRSPHRCFSTVSDGSVMPGVLETYTRRIDPPAASMHSPETGHASCARWTTTALLGRAGAGLS